MYISGEIRTITVNNGGELNITFTVYIYKYKRLEYYFTGLFGAEEPVPSVALATHTLRGGEADLTHSVGVTREALTAGCSCGTVNRAGQEESSLVRLNIAKIYMYVYSIVKCNQ